MDEKNEKEAEKKNPRTAYVEALVEQIDTEIDKFFAARKRSPQAEHPGRKWASILWQYHEAHPGTPAAAKAVGHAMYLLMNARQYDEVISRAGSLKPWDSAWSESRVVVALYQAYEHKNDLSAFVQKAGAVVEGALDKRARALLQLYRGHAYWELKQPEEAKAALEAAHREAPNWDAGKKAKGFLFEYSHLNEGQVVPAFAAKATDGGEISPESLRGKVVLLDFWASWCGPCIADMPALKKLHKKYAKKGLLVVGVNMDSDEQDMKKMLASKKLAWQQVFDGKGWEAELARFFNVQGIPTVYVLDREGRIVKKTLGSGQARELEKAITAALGK